MAVSVILSMKLLIMTGITERVIVSIRFADDIADIARVKNDKISTKPSRPKNGNRARETNVTTNSPYDSDLDIRVNGTGLESVKSFKYLKFTIDEGSKPDILSRPAQTTAELTKLKLI